MKKQSNLSAASRKLSLGKKTISNLTSNEMSQKVGGTTGSLTCGGATVCKNHTCYNGKTCHNYNTCYTC